MEQAEHERGLGETLEFMRLLWSVDHALQRTSKRMDRELGVTGTQRLVLRVLGSRPGLSAGEVARTLKLHPSTLTGILQRLEARRLIRREADPQDGRRSHLRLTGVGEAVNGARSGTVEEGVERALGTLSATQIDGARAVLDALARELEAGLPADPRDPRPHRK